MTLLSPINIHDAEIVRLLRITELLFHPLRLESL